MHMVPALVEACVLLQRGDAEAAWAVLGEAEPPDDTHVAAADEAAALGLCLLQRGDVSGAIARLEGMFRVAEDDGPRMALGSRLALAYAASRRGEEARAVIDELGTRGGGTYSDRMLALWAEGLVYAQTGDGDARASVDAAHAIATATDARLEHAIAALARAKVLAAFDDPDAVAVAGDAQRQLDGLGITADGWARVFDEALAGVPAPERR
jgi:hypothetical protein